MIELNKQYELALRVSLSTSAHGEYYQEDYQVTIPLYVECSCGAEEDTNTENELWMEVSLYSGSENVESLGIAKQADRGIECSVTSYGPELLKKEEEDS